MFSSWQIFRSHKCQSCSSLINLPDVELFVLFHAFVNLCRCVALTRATLNNSRHFNHFILASQVPNQGIDLVFGTCWSVCRKREIKGWSESSFEISTLSVAGRDDSKSLWTFPSDALLLLHLLFLLPLLVEDEPGEIEWQRLAIAICILKKLNHQCCRQTKNA